MSLTKLLQATDFGSAGEQMFAFAAELLPICRSITGAGVRETLRRIRQQIPLTIHEVPSGEKVFDWTIPREWNIRDAWVKNSRGEKVIDFRRSNLHVVNYSIPYQGRLTLAELRPRLHSLPEHPDWIPYRTSYYKEDWGFCLPHRVLQELEDGEYEVCIDTDLEAGSLTYGELLLPGTRPDEVLISCHVCHPSLCNDNLSGIVLTVALAKLLGGVSRDYSYRFLLIPGTIGSICWLARNEERASRIQHGLVAACVGDPGPFHYKRSRRGNAEIDRAVLEVLRHRQEGYQVRDFTPYGYDERQYNSPGFNLPVGCLSRTPHGQYPEYHTSADDLKLIRPQALAASLSVYLSVLHILESNKRCINLNPRCEPQLGRRGLYRSLGGFADAGRSELAMLWVLNLSDGHSSLLDIAERSGLPFELIARTAEILKAHDLLAEAKEGSP